MTMTYVAAPPAVVLATATAVVPRRRRSRAQMKALDLLCQYAACDLCRGAIGPFRKKLCQALLQLDEFEQCLAKRLHRQPSRAISIATAMISHGGLHVLESSGLERPAAMSYGHRDGRQSSRRDGVDHRHASPSGRWAIAAPNRRRRPRCATRSCPCMSSVGSVRGIQRGRCMRGNRLHCRCRPGLQLSSVIVHRHVPVSVPT